MVAGLCPISPTNPTNAPQPQHIPIFKRPAARSRPPAHTGCRYPHVCAVPPAPAPRLPLPQHAQASAARIATCAQKAVQPSSLSLSRCARSAARSRAPARAKQPSRMPGNTSKYVEFSRLWQDKITISQQGADLRRLTGQARAFPQRSASGQTSPSERAPT